MLLVSTRFHPLATIRTRPRRSAGLAFLEVLLEPFQTDVDSARVALDPGQRLRLWAPCHRTARRQAMGTWARELGRVQARPLLEPLEVLALNLVHAASSKRDTRT